MVSYQAHDYLTHFNAITDKGPLYLLASAATGCSSATTASRQPPLSFSSFPIYSTEVHAVHVQHSSGVSYGIEPLRRSHTPTDSQSDSVGSPPHCSPKRKRRSMTSSTSQLQNKAKIQRRRRELMDLANRVKSVGNSPVNDQQLLILRMVFYEITMYPCEIWMLIIAFIIRRTYKQVKNWFSNERQKYDGSGFHVTSTEIDGGDKLRLRPLALQLCDRWSDAFFEEVILIYNFKTLQNQRYEEKKALEASRDEQWSSFCSLAQHSSRQSIQH